MKRAIFGLLMLAVLSTAQAQETAAVNERILTLLRTYSPDGARIVEMEMAIENAMNPVNPSQYIERTPCTDENIVHSIQTVVHEAHHGLTRYGQELVYEISGRGDISYQNDYFALPADDFSLVKKTETFPSREMVAWFPEERQSRFLFFPYVTEPRDIVSTQQSGVFGLLHEFAAYYFSAKTRADFFPFYEERGAHADWQRFLIDITFYLYGSKEFKYYIVTYLNYAQQHHPKIYNDLIQHKPFLYTFFELDRLVEGLYAHYMEGREHVFHLLPSYGITGWVDDLFLYLEQDGKTKKRMHLVDAAQELETWMDQGDYARQIAAMKASLGDWQRENFEKDLEGMTLRLPVKSEPLEDGWQPFEGLQAVVDDTEQDVEYSFVDFKRAGVALNPDGSMWIHMELADIPEKLPCDQPGVRPSEFEYIWKMYFTILGDPVSHYSFDLYEYGARGPYITDIMGECVKGVYQDALVDDFEIEGRQVGNTLILHVKANPRLQVDRERVRIYFETQYNNGEKKVQDYLPDYRMPNTLVLDHPRY